MKRIRIQNVSAAVLYVLLAVSLVVVALFFLGGETPLAEQLLADPALREPAYTGALMVWVYVLAGLTVMVCVYSIVRRFAMQMADNPRAGLKSLLGVALLALLLAVSWGLGSTTPLPMPGYEGTENTAFWLRIVDMLLYTIYTLLILLVLLIVASRFLKR